MKMLDQVRLGDYTIAYAIADFLDRGKLDAQVKLAVPIDITEVKHWSDEEWFKNSTNERRERHMQLFHDLRASFRTSWFEWTLNQIVGEPGRQYRRQGRAVLTLAHECKWTMVLFERVNDEVVATHSWGTDTAEISAEILHLLIPTAHGEDLHETRLLLASVTIPVLMAQTLMHCKNVRTAEVPTPPKVAAKFESKHGIRPAKFRTVVIAPMREVIARAGGVGVIGVERAMHIVRGNFATYTEDAPLFGKVAGRFFRPQHARGNADAGVKPPSYKVKP